MNKRFQVKCEESIGEYETEQEALHILEFFRRSSRNNPHVNYYLHIAEEEK